jgi:formylmethanofuran dehydrogenase subunit E
MIKTAKNQLKGGTPLYPMAAIETCIFKRTKDSAWEPGIRLETKGVKILDREGNEPAEVWDYKEYSGFKIETDWFLGKPVVGTIWCRNCNTAIAESYNPDLMICPQCGLQHDTIQNDNMVEAVAAN